MEEEKFIATKSAWAGITIPKVLFAWLIIPLIIMILRIIEVKRFKMIFYNNKIVIKSGIFSTKEKHFAFNGVIGASIHQSLWGKLCKCGDISVDVPGKWTISTCGIKHPQKLKEYLLEHMINNSDSILVN